MTQKGMIDGGKMSNGIGVFTSWQSGKPPVPRISQERADGTRKKERESEREREQREARWRLLRGTKKEQMVAAE